ncbi:hypothetical protein [Aquimarina litoralis]|uniref:hypothetical protein n=1 Tax=Aquimarina litoralis TaxID=584605 RepID=UPI001C571ECB|nr:hypothetical protein [Aquimarina litoralis]MBW1297852.1 hypothetical protein [Aquimarina litoralis]
MVKRKEFKNIANGVLQSFISRNNDVEGYWGIGKLYSLLLKKNEYEVEIDLINKTILPADKEFENMIQFFSKKLFNQMKRKGLKNCNLTEAKIALTSFPNTIPLSLGKIAHNQMQCNILLVDDLQKTHPQTKSIWCRKHNPKLEIKRGKD